MYLIWDSYSFIHAEAIEMAAKVKACYPFN